MGQTLSQFVQSRHLPKSILMGVDWLPMIPENVPTGQSTHQARARKKTPSTIDITVVMVSVLTKAKPMADMFGQAK